jgi:hypothetical protein
VASDFLKEVLKLEDRHFALAGLSILYLTSLSFASCRIIVFGHPIHGRQKIFKAGSGKGHTINRHII